MIQSRYAALAVGFGIILAIPHLSSSQVRQKEFALMSGDVVGVGELQAVGRTPRCTATLITQHVALTAAHCVCPRDTDANGCDERTPFTLMGVRPVDDPSTPADESLNRRDVSIAGTVHVHPQYTQQGWLRKDLALIVLDQPAYTVAKDVSPLQVAGPNTVVKVGEKLTLVGFGMTGPDCSQPGTGKQKTTLTVTDVVPDAIRFANSGGGTACPGDSGGPAINTDNLIVGVASWSDSRTESTYRPTSENYEWIAGVRDSWDLVDEPEGLWVSSGRSADLDAHKAPYPYQGKMGIVGMGIAGSNDHVYVWYDDGSVSSGTSSGLDAYRSSYPYSLPSGKTPADIVGMGIAGSNDRVFAWYSDGNVSSGTSSDLDANRSPSPYSLPSGKTPADIVGMGIAGSNDRVYVWYSDGTVSVGTSSDLDSHTAPYKFTLPSHKAPEDIVGMGIAGSNDWVYTWYKYVLK